MQDMSINKSHGFKVNQNHREVRIVVYFLNEVREDGCTVSPLGRKASVLFNIYQ